MELKILFSLSLKLVALVVLFKEKPVPNIYNHLQMHNLCTVSNPNDFLTSLSSILFLQLRQLGSSGLHMYAEAEALTVMSNYSTQHRLGYQNFMLKLNYPKFRLFINLINLDGSDNKSMGRLKKFSRLHAKFQIMFLHMIP